MRCGGGGKVDCHWLRGGGGSKSEEAGLRNKVNGFGVLVVRKARIFDQE